MLFCTDGHLRHVRQDNCLKSKLFVHLYSARHLLEPVSVARGTVRPLTHGVSDASKCLTKPSCHKKVQLFQLKADDLSLQRPDPVETASHVFDLVETIALMNLALLAGS
ncbi:unnamed protein product [Durusdinium trenchii]|uniref:Uncharacterized protein n=1 Tax=Durusdinium trenchii TaxID=1381693 RepID=A0ABP0HC81_9DINO